MSQALGVVHLLGADLAPLAGDQLPRRRHAARAPVVQPAGNLAASLVAGLLWTLISPSAAFAYLTLWMLAALLTLVWVSPRRAAVG